MRALLLVGLLLGCHNDETDSERHYVDKELGELDQHLAAKDEAKVLIDCVSLRTSQPRMAPAVVAKIDTLCDVEMPRLMLTNALAEASDNVAKHPDMGDLNCAQLFVKDALEAMARHTPVDPALQKLADDYKRLCPKPF